MLGNFECFFFVVVVVIVCGFFLNELLKKKIFQKYIQSIKQLGSADQDRHFVRPVLGQRLSADDKSHH